MPNSVHQNIHGSWWPLGLILVPTPGTPVRITNLIDPTNVNAPETLSSATSYEYTFRAQQIQIQAYKLGGTPPKLANNTGLLYIVRKALAGAGGTTDVGTIITVLAPGQSWNLGSAALNRNVFNLYDYFLDVDTANDGGLVSVLIQ